MKRPTKPRPLNLDDLVSFHTIDRNEFVIGSYETVGELQNYLKTLNENTVIKVSEYGYDGGYEVYLELLDEDRFEKDKNQRVLAHKEAMKKYEKEYKIWKKQKLLKELKALES